MHGQFEILQVIYSPPPPKNFSDHGVTLQWSSGCWGLALKKGAEGSDEQRLTFLSFWIRRSAALCIGTLYIFTHFMFSDPWGNNSASSKFGRPRWHSRSLAASFSTTGCGVLLPDTPKAYSKITKAAFTPTSTAGDVKGTTHACTGLQGPTLPAARCSAAPNNEVCAFMFYSECRYCFFGDMVLQVM